MVYAWWGASLATLPCKPSTPTFGKASELRLTLYKYKLDGIYATMRGGVLVKHWFDVALKSSGGRARP